MSYSKGAHRRRPTKSTGGRTHVSLDAAAVDVTTDLRETLSMKTDTDMKTTKETSRARK